MPMNPVKGPSGKVWASQRIAAKALGVSEEVISRHLKKYGDLESVGCGDRRSIETKIYGHTFKTRAEAARMADVLPDRVKSFCEGTATYTTMVSIASTIDKMERIGKLPPKGAAWHALRTLNGGVLRMDHIDERAETKPIPSRASAADATAQSIEEAVSAAFRVVMAKKKREQ